jgi:hypothetical protein
MVFGNVKFFFNKVGVISENIRKKPWGQHHQTKLSMARTPAIIYISSLFSISNLYGFTTSSYEFAVHADRQHSPIGSEFIKKVEPRKVEPNAVECRTLL